MNFKLGILNFFAFADECVPKYFNVSEDELELRNRILCNKMQEIPPQSPLPIDLLR